MEAPLQFAFAAEAVFSKAGDDFDTAAAAPPPPPDPAELCRWKTYDPYDPNISAHSAGCGLAAADDVSMIGDDFDASPPSPEPAELCRCKTFDPYDPIIYAQDAPDEQLPASLAETMQPTHVQTIAPAMSVIPMQNPGFLVMPVLVPTQPALDQQLMMTMMMQIVGQGMMHALLALYAHWLEAATDASAGVATGDVPSKPPPDIPHIVPPGEPPEGKPSVRPADDASLASARAPVLERTFSVSSSAHLIRWTVDAKKLNSSDREAVSPSFGLEVGKPAMFKLKIKPKKVHDLRGGASFKKAKGKGSVELLCLEDVASIVNFRVAVGSGQDPGEPLGGPVTHDFSEGKTCGLEATWDFSKHVDEETQTFVVVLEILPSAATTGATPKAAP
mmetsp:Transcript_106438/g.266735  ORF Transcript_106438/g.266735 Transcript_106438/m.266735 type:complete len:389 (+) Transcript_106438:92-1258(+)